LVFDEQTKGVLVSLQHTAVAVRAATAADAVELAELVVLMYESMGLDVRDVGAGWRLGLPGWYEQRFAREPDSFAGFVAEEDGKVVGGCTVWTLSSLPRPGNPSGRRGYVAGMYVHEVWRGRGVARRLLMAGLGWMRERGIELAELHATEMGAPLYESVGFEAVAAYRLEVG